MENKLELLAPVGDREMFTVAINNGADAVYLGLKNFNARMKADNFSNQDLREIVKFAHINNVKVYVTVNTIITDKEVETLIESVKHAVECKVDAFIVQDLGVSYILRNKFKNIVLHASTQMGVHNLEGAKQLEKMGFSRVVLSRETSLEDIKLIKNNTNLEIEYFVHGALCVAFSGNCYLSSMVKDKSGNRGECLQLCRLCYTAKENNKEINKGYLLSTRDLCYVSRIKELINAGVTSFKIEGRLKRPAYVAQTLQVYKKILNNREITNQDEFNLKKVFSRGDFNKGEYLYNKNENIINKDIQNHLGVKIGTIEKIEKFKDLHKIFINSKHKLSQNDGLKFVNKNGYVKSLGVGNVEIKNGLYVIYSKTYPNEKDDVYLTVDSVYENMLLASTKKIKINAIFKAQINKRATLILKCEDVEVLCKSESVCEMAKNSCITKDNVKNAISKIKDTCFEIENFEIEMGENIFISLKELNQLRREAIEKIENALALKNETKSFEFINKELKDDLFIENTNKQILYISKVEEIEKGLKNCLIIFNPNNYNNITVEKAMEYCNKNTKNCDLYLNLPIISNYKDMEIIRNILKNNNIGIVINNLYGVDFAVNRKVIVGYGLNIANSFAIKQLNELGIKGLFFKSIENFIPIFNEKLLQWKSEIPLMTFKHCPFKLNYGTNCENCSFNKNLTYTSESGTEYKINRKKIFYCYHELIKK